MKKRISLVFLVGIMATAFAVTQVVVSEVKSGNIREILSFSGEIKPFVEYIVAPDVSSTVMAVNVEDGMPVNTGEVLITLDRKRYQIALDQVDGALKNAQQKNNEAQNDYKRNKILFDEHVINQKSFESTQTALSAAKSGLASAKAAHELAELNLNRTEIKAPISGFFAGRDVILGQTVSPGMILGRVLDLKTVYAETKISENQIRLVSQGQQCMVEGTYPAKVAYVDLYADSSRAYRVKLMMDNTAGFKAGMYVKGEIIVNNYENVPLVPETALLQLKGAYSVFSVLEGKAKQQSVEPVAKENGLVFAKGISAGDNVVVTGQGTLKDGDSVSLAGEGK
ncbi:MAG: efflux RND transporter periplasmic adaptor subunit [Candidatus Wallbacteria bacterium]|nr:efflux RND transporter periplasmic adaptor subunit [Candidatus Wallbacteria bacterium]